MRNLKKVLALTLAVVMLVGMMVVGASAVDYKDAAAIEHKEAAGVMSAIGVFNGTETGEFLPQGNLTRETAAKIITYMLMGKASADKLGTATAPFNDVAATRWSAGSIAYCVSTGILAGDGNGNFFPTQNVDGYAFGKMLLVAIGATGEYTGANWAINVAKDVIAFGLDKNVCAGLADVLTRDEACQMAFNALNYTANEKTTKYVAAGKTFESFIEAYLFAGADATKVEVVTVSTGSLANTVYGLESNKTVDAFGRPTITWTGKNKVKVVVDADATATYTTAISASKLYNALGLEKTTDATVWTDGVESTVTLAKADTKTMIGAAGVTTEIFVDENNAITIVNVTDVLAEVTEVVKAKAATATTDATKAYVKVSGGYTYETDAFAKGDKVIINVAGGEIKAIVKAETVDGIYGGAKGTTIKVSGASYTLTANNTVDLADLAANNKATYTFYLDTNGNIIAAAKKDDAAVITDYVYVTKVQTKGATDADLIDAAAKGVAKAAIINVDGTKATVDLAITTEKVGTTTKYYVAMPKADGTVAKTELALNAATIGTWFAYTVKDGAYTLEAINTTYATVETKGVKLNEKAATAVAGKYTNSATVVTAYDENGVKTTFKGLAAKATDLTGAVLVTYAKDAKVVSAIYAVEQAVATAEDVTYAYAVAEGFTSADGKTTDWTFSVDGKQIDKAVAAGTVTAGTIYTLKDNGDGTWTATALEAGKLIADKKIDVLDASFCVIEGTPIAFAEKMAVYNIDADLETENVAMADELAEGDTISYILNKDGAIAIAYITVEAE